MRIGIDAKWYFNGPVGPRSYVRNFINALALLDQENEYIIYLNKNDDPAAVEFSAPNFTVKTLSPSNSWLRVFFKLSLVASRDKLDLLYTNNFCPLFCSCKRVVMVYDIIFVTHPELFTLLERVFFNPIRWASRRAEKVITISDYCKKTISEHFRIDPAKIETTLMGCNDAFKRSNNTGELEAVRQRYGLPERYLLYVGRLNVRKNLLRLIEAFSGIQDQDIKLVVVGSKDWKSSNLAGAVEQSPARDRIQFLGYVPDEDLPKVYELATAFAYVSLVEGFGFPALEAMGCGVPSIISNTSSLPEVVGDCALMVDPYDVNDIRTAIDTLIASPKLREELSSKGSERAKLFSWEQTTKNTLQVFKSVVGLQE